MQFYSFSRVGLAGAMLAALLWATVAATASSGREFSGYFDVSGVQEQGDLVQVTLHVKLFNHGDVDARSVIVTLVDSSPAMTLRGNFQPVKIWKSHKFLEMSQQFTVTKREFREWMAPPAQPNLIILFQDNQGATWQRGAQISRYPLVPKEQ
ncbi:MAG TPA: hypothetical protein VE377_01415 [Candidatus Dormibacteraeota bacterium]|nr:hypothetical protein [Candidatus Dormibacteraeota bacterium]